MAEEAIEKPRNAEPQPDEQPTNNPDKKAFWKRFLTKKWIITIVAVSVVVQGFGFLYFRFAGGSQAERPNAEVSLGTFHFEADGAELGGIARAEFALYIALLKHADSPARQRLESHKFRVQQDVEELLREAHSGDFDDPKLGQLKRQLQEQVNETLEIRAIADVIITDLKIQRGDTSQGTAAAVAETVPWVEKPSS